MSHIATPGFVIPERMLPDGSIEWASYQGSPGDLVRRLEEYDPRLSLVMNTREDRWELWRLGEDGKARRISTLAGLDRLPNGDQLLAQIAAFDTHRGYDPVEAMIAEDDRLLASRRRDFADEQEDVADKLHWALANDLSSHAPAARPIPTGGRP